MTNPKSSRVHFDFKSLSLTELKTIFIDSNHYGKISDPNSIAQLAWKEHASREEQANNKQIESQKQQIKILEVSVIELLNRFDRIIELLYKVIENPLRSFFWALLLAVLSGIAINLGTELSQTLINRIF